VLSAAMQRRNYRRKCLARERDELCVKEAGHVEMMRRLGRHSFLEQRAVVDERAAAELLKERRRIARETDKEKTELRDQVFGAESLFASAKEHFFAEVVVERPCDAFDVWSQEGAEVVLSAITDTGDDAAGAVVPLSHLGFCSLGCGESYVLSVAQVLLRTSSVVRWLSWHAGRCDRGVTCATCALWNSRRQLGEKAVPELVVRRARVHSRFAGAGVRDAIDFFRALSTRCPSGKLRLGAQCFGKVWWGGAQSLLLMVSLPLLWNSGCSVMPVGGEAPDSSTKGSCALLCLLLRLRARARCMICI
jgi:hypothetical protein